MLINRINQRICSVAKLRNNIKTPKVATKFKNVIYPKNPPSNLRAKFVGALLLAQSLFLPTTTSLQKTSAKINTPSFLIEKLDILRKSNKIINNEIEDKNFQKIFNMVQKIVPDVSKEFIGSIITTSKKVNCYPEDLTAIMYIESKFRPEIGNQNFVGLGQMNRLALKLSQKYAKENPSEQAGINFALTHSEFAKLTREQQIPYVKNFILAMKDAYVKNPDKKMTGGELYALFFTPARFNNKFLTAKNDSATSKYYIRNRKLDFNKDGMITKNDLQNILDNVKVVSMGMKK